MRKDVKIGLGIGGVLLAVLIVYVLVPKNDDRGDLARNGESPNSTDDTSGAGGSGGLTPSQSDTTSGASADAGRDTAGQAVDQGIGQGSGTTETAATGQDSASQPPKKLDWETMLATGIVPDDARIGLVAQNPPTQSPVEDIFADKTPGKSQEPDWSGGATGGSTRITPVTPAPSNTNQVSGSNGSNVTAPRTANGASRAGVKEHVVQQGENLSMIAAVAYGDARHYREILKANPNLDERKLRPGTVIKMPDASTFAAPKAQQAAARQQASVDNKTEYRVQQGDSLHKIALKLYGKAAKADALYEANKDKIGDDSSRLKLDMVLKLPEPPTAN